MPAGERRLALAVPIDGLTFSESLEIAASAERLGYTDGWSYEVAGGDGFSPLGWLAARTERMRLGISLVPAFTRPPALLAMSCEALQQISGGRFVLGLGSSSPTVVGNWMGLVHDKPLQRVRETVEALARILAGEKTTYEGSTLSVRDFRLALDPAPTPVMLGALGPKMLALAGEIGDGVILVFNAAQATRARGERREALAAVSDELLHELYVFGSASECAARLEAYTAAGVCTPLIAPTTAAADLDTRRRKITGTIELAARTLAPALV